MVPALTPASASGPEPVRTIDLPSPPTSSPPPEPQHGAAVVAAVLSCASGATFALLAGDARYLLVCVVMAAGSVGLSLLVRRRAVQAQRRSDARAREAYLRVVDAAVREASAAASRQRARLEAAHPRVSVDAVPGHDPPPEGDVGANTGRSPVRAGSGSVPVRVRPRPPSVSRRRRMRTTRAPSLPSPQRSPR